MDPYNVYVNLCLMAICYLFVGIANISWNIIIKANINIYDGLRASAVNDYKFVNGGSQRLYILSYITDFNCNTTYMLCH